MPVDLCISFWVVLFVGDKGVLLPEYRIQLNTNRGKPAISIVRSVRIFWGHPLDVIFSQPKHPHQLLCIYGAIMIWYEVMTGTYQHKQL